MSRVKKLTSVLMILILVLTILPVSVFAKGSYSASLSTSTIYVGKSASVNISTKNAAGKFTVTSSDPSVAAVTLAATWVDGKMDNAISVKGLKAGTATITITPVNVADDDYNLITATKSLKITVKAQDASSSSSSNTKTKSSNALLQKLTLKVGNIEFDPNTTKYSVDVDKSVTSLGLEAVAQDSKAKVEVSGDKDFKVGANSVLVTVTAENGTKKVYEITVMKSSYGAGPLTNLGIKGYTLTPKFVSNELKYTVNVSDVNSVEVEYTLADSNSKVNVIGANNLKEGVNNVQVVVTEVDGTVTTYEIHVGVVNNVVNKNNNIIWLVVIALLVVLVVAETIYIVIKNKKNEQVK